MSDKAFDPARYIVKLRGKEYLEVKWRLVWLRTEHPDAVLETEMVSLDTDRQFCVFKARVAIPSGGSATGWGQEEAADFGDYLEKAETKAIGRALGALGYGTQFTEDFDFASGGEPRVVDSPVERPRPAGGHLVDEAKRQGAVPLNERLGTSPPPPRPPGNSAPAFPATEPQIKAVYAIGRAAQHMSDTEIDARCQELYGVTPSGLSKRQASEFIDALKGGRG